ncbi:MAG: fatty acid desaturase [Spirochaetota bacterium]
MHNDYFFVMGSSQKLQQIRIPNRLNTLLTLLVFTTSIALLAFSEQSLYWQILMIIAFAHLHMTSYALLHEATHLNLHSKPRYNYVLGFLSGLLFPTSITLATLTHTKHHCCNRSNHEMFDYYYPNDNLFLKFGQWYSLLLGGFWPLVLLGNLVLCIYPRLPQNPWVLRIKSSQRMLEDLQDYHIRKIRLETFSILLFWLGMFFFTPLTWKTCLLFYLVAGWNWSTRQYITHAFSKRDVWQGAWNLKTNIIHEKILLNGNWDLEHHLNPELPWLYLAKSGKTRGYHRPYLRQYALLWLGPRKNFERAPLAIPREEYFKGYHESTTTDVPA